MLGQSISEEFREPDQPFHGLKSDFSFKLKDLASLRQGQATNLIATLASNLIALALPIVIIQVYGRVIPNETESTLILMTIGLCVAFAFDAVFRMGRAYLSSQAGAKFEFEIGCMAVKRILYADQSDVEKRQTATLLEQIISSDKLRDFYTNQGIPILIDLPFVVIFLAFIAMIGGVLVFVPIIIFTLFVISAMILAKMLQSSLEDRSRRDDHRKEFIIELFQGIHTVKSMAMEGMMMRRYERMMEGSTRASYNTIFLSSMSQSLGVFFSQVSMASVAAIGATFVLLGEFSIGGLIACTMLSGRTLQPLIRAMAVWTSFQGIKVVKKQISEVLTLDLERDGPGKRDVNLAGTLKLQNVGLKFDDTGQELFSNINLEIQPNQTIAIVGENGCGKSVLLNLILGIYRPTSGQVLIGGTDVGDIDADLLNRNIGYAADENSLFQGTILQNITMFREDSLLEKKALETAVELGLDKFVSHLPQGFSTTVADSSVQSLPSGVSQRITLARALLNDPPILIFDEIDRGLDNESEDLLYKALSERKGAQTLIITTSSEKIVSLADRKFELADGELTEQAPKAHAHNTQLDNM